MDFHFPNFGPKYGPFKQNKVHCWYVLLRLQQSLKKHCTLNKANSYIHLIFRIHKIMNLMGWHIFLNIINIFIWLLNTLQSSQWDGLFTTALLAWYLPQLQARSNLKDDCHRVLVPKSQVENILQCFGLIFILMDRLGALLSTLGANLVKERFFRDTLYLVNGWRPIDGVQASKDVLDCPLISNFFYKQEYHCESQRLSPECNIW